MPPQKQAGSWVHDSTKDRERPGGTQPLATLAQGLM